MEPSFFTINACNRCRKRKARCDTGMPACRQCQIAGSVCQYTDQRSKETHTRSHIHELEEQVFQLEADLQRLRSTEEPGATATISDLNKLEEFSRPDLICLVTGGDAHFLGGSSGMSLARSVLESTRQNTKWDNNDATTASHQSKPKSTRLGKCPESTQAVGDYLPSQDAATSLIDFFLRQYQVQYPILHYAEFMEEVSELYAYIDSGQDGSDDPRTKFMLRIVMAISLQLLSEDDPESLDLAEGFKASALRQLSVVLQTKSSRTLQCLLLLLLSSLLNSRSAPMWYISGLCMRMCVDLGYHLERTIQQETGEQKKDNMRRLFWVSYTFDRSLATMLGRPFFLNDERIDVEFPRTSIPLSKRRHVHHWLTMQQIQSETVHTIHTSRNAAAKSDGDSASFLNWQARLTERLTKWEEESIELGDSDEHNMDWWRCLYHNAMLMLHRPSSNGLQVSSRSPHLAYESARDILHLSFIRAHKNLPEFTWLDLHGQIISGLTLLFLVLRDPDARANAQNNWISFKSCVVEWQVVLEKLCRRWEQMARTNDVLAKLADETVDIVDKSGSRANPAHGGRLSARDRYYRATRKKGLGPSTRPAANASSAEYGQAQHGDVDKVGTDLPSTDANGVEVQRGYGGPYEEQTSYQTSMPRSNTILTTSNEPLDFNLENPEFWWHPDNIDLSVLLTADISLGFGQCEMLSQQDVGSFDNFPLFLGQIKSFGAPGNGVPGAIDTTMTDSVLNFHDLENGP